MQAGFFKSLFDLSFRKLITPRIIKVLYVISLVVIGILTLIFFISALIALTDQPAAGLIGLILTPLFGLLYVIYARVFLEIVIALFHVMQNTSELVRIGGGQPATSGVFTAPSVAQMPPATPAAGGQLAATGGAPAAQQQPQEPGWYPDPQGQAALRYWDGSSWTSHTSE